MTTSQTRGQFERTLSQRISALYFEQLGHRPSLVTCQLLDNKLMVVVEDSITQAEQLLVQQGQDTLVEQVRSGLNAAIETQLKQVVEEALNVQVTDLLIDATLETGRTGMILVLSEAPQFRISTSKSRNTTVASLRS